MPKNKQISNHISLESLRKIAEKFHFLKYLFLFLDQTSFTNKPLSINNDGYDPNSGTRAKYENCEITIEWHIVLYGEWIENNFFNGDVVDDACEKIENDMEERWNKDKNDKNGDGKADGDDPWRVQCKTDCEIHEPGCIVRFDANVTAYANPKDDDIPKGGEAQTPKGEGSHWIHLNGPSKPKGAYVNSWGPGKNLPKPNNGMETTGEFNVNDIEGVWAHEAGHLLGLIDEYITFSVDLPFGWDFSFNIPLSDGIMAHPDNYPTQDDINEAVKNSGIECPCECCPEVDNKKPVVTPTSPNNNTKIPFSQPVNIIGYATDDLSGVVEFDYSLNWDGGFYDGNSVIVDPPENLIQFTLGPITPDNYVDIDDDWLTIKIYATDKAGNTGSASLTILRDDGQEDTTPPVTEKIIGEPNENGGYSIWPITPIIFESTDDLSGVDYIHYDIWWDSDGDMVIDIQMASETIYEDTTTFSVVEYGILFGLIELNWYAVDNEDNHENIHNQEHFVNEG
ncbi:hypothetical protein ACFL1L_04095 [Thermoplasmatota archaeon]